MFLGFGEIMARLCPPERLRWRQTLPGRVEVTWGGGEANVCASLSLFGLPARFLTALPSQPISDALVGTLRGLGVDVNHILWRKEGRLGLYFVEAGANQRGSTVHYDRAYSAISLAGPEEYDFASALAGVKHVHLTGITPAISENGFRSTLALAQLAREKSIRVSCDVNFRKKLWTWRPGTSAKALARDCMTQLLRHVDLVIANEEDAADVLDIHAAATDVTHGQINAAAYEHVAREIVRQFPSVSQVAITLRESLSADHNRWGAMLFDTRADRAFLAPLGPDGQYQPYDITDIVDRVGGGDSFAAGLLYGLSAPDLGSPDKALAFAVAASCLKHSIQGDFNYTSRDEVLALVKGNASGRVQR